MTPDREAKRLYACEYAKRPEVRERQRLRSVRRRKNPSYNAAQIIRKRLWRLKNKEHYLATSRVYDRHTLRNNPQRRISKNLRHRIGKAMKGLTRGVSAVRDLGISIYEFREYIAAKFKPEMSWDNYGKWHLDHIRPLDSFDLTDRSQALEACHYTNYQPLWALDNQRKHAAWSL